MMSNRMCWTCGVPRTQTVESTPSGSVYVCGVCGTTRLVSSVEDGPHDEIPPPHTNEAAKRSSSKPATDSQERAE